MHEIEVGLVGVISELTIHKFTTKHTSPPNRDGAHQKPPFAQKKTMKEGLEKKKSMLVVLHILHTQHTH